VRFQVPQHAQDRRTLDHLQQRVEPEPQRVRRQRLLAVDGQQFRRERVEDDHQQPHEVVRA
jgi:hypothetical protein